VKQSVTDNGYCVIVVSEGAAWPDGKFPRGSRHQGMRSATRSSAAWAPWWPTWCAKRSATNSNWAVADYLQRAGRHIASKVDVEQAYAVGKAAVELAVKGVNAVMPTIVRKAAKPYKWTLGHVPLEPGGQPGKRKVPREFVTEDGFGITEACRRYLEPLIAGEDYPPYKNGLPDYVKIKGVLVKKKLATELQTLMPGVAPHENSF